ncbi:reverse transcriptase domain-containing protein [Tanacetum coccineum]
MRNQSNELKNDLKNMMSNFFQMNSPSGSGSLPSNIVANPRGDLKAITTRSGVSYDGPTILPTSSPLPKEVEHEPEATKDKVQPTSSGSTTHVQPPVVQVPISEPDIAPKPNPKLSIPYPSRINDQKLQEKANYQMLKFLQIFQRLQFDLSFADALLHIPKFASTFKSLFSNKEKLFELANTPLNENSLAVLLKKLPEKLGDPGKFLIPCDFPELVECLALADLGASINLMSLSLWKKLSLPEHTPTRMNLELANRSVAYSVGAEDVFVKVGKKSNHPSSGGTTSHSDLSLPDYEVLCFEEKSSEQSSGSTTTHTDYSLPEYDALYFNDDHIKEKSSGSTTTHSDFSLPKYDSFIFDLSIDPFPPVDKSVPHHEEFANERAHIISPPEYDHFYFDIKPDPGELTILFEENISKDSTKEFTSLELNDFPLLLSDCDSTFSEEFSEIDLLVLFPSENKDKVFDPGIFIIKRV